MSGLEIAGVVLGALPLIISALEHYAKGVSTAKRFLRYKSELQSTALAIKTERTILVDTLAQIYDGIIPSDMILEFRQDPGKASWKSSNIDPGIQKRLGPSYNVYMGNMEQMQIALQSIMEKLGLDCNGQPTFQDASMFRQEYERLKFSIRKSEYTEQINNLRNHNLALRRLTQHTLNFESSRAQDSVKSCPKFRILQNCARALFSMLQRGLKCSCDDHAVNLRLEPRSFQNEEDAAEQTDFRVVFTYASGKGAPKIISTFWQEAVIGSVLERSKRAMQCSPGSPFGNKRVRSGQIHQSTQHAGGEGSTSHSYSGLVPDGASHQIVDLCEALGRLSGHQQQLCIGYLLDEINHKHGIFPLTSPPGNDRWAAYSLRYLLATQASNDHHMSRIDALRLAVALASSVLQLHKTPWFNEVWSDEDVYFLHRPNMADVSIYEHPFVHRSISTHVADGSMTRHDECGVIRNNSLFALGIVLIELLYRKSMKELKIARDEICQGTPGIAWCTAMRLINNGILGEGGPHYLAAVRRCIRCDFDQSSSSLDDENFQGAVYAGVVLPLQMALGFFTNPPV